MYEKKRVPARKKVQSELKHEFDRLNDRVTTIAQVFTDSVKEMRDDVRTLDGRIHSLLEEGIIAKLNERVVKIEEQTGLLGKSATDLDNIKIEVAKIDQKVTGLMWAMAITIGPAVAYLLTTWLAHLFGGPPTP